jgi:hypothetical protein
MNETGAYTDQLIIPFRERLDALKEILKKDMESDKHPEPIVRLMMKKLDGVGECWPLTVWEDRLMGRTTTQRII